MKVHDVVVLREVAGDASTVSTECSPSGFPTPFTTR